MTQKEIDQYNKDKSGDDVISPRRENCSLCNGTGVFINQHTGVDYPCRCPKQYCKKRR